MSVRTLHTSANVNSRNNGRLRLGIHLAAIVICLGLPKAHAQLTPVIAYSNDGSGVDLMYSTYPAPNWAAPGSTAVAGPFTGPGWALHWKTAYTRPDHLQHVVMFHERDLSSRDRIWVAFWDGTNWDDGRGGIGSAEHLDRSLPTNFRQFGGAYEQVSGDFLAVHGTNTDEWVDYYLHDGTSWVIDGGNEFFSNVGTNFYLFDWFRLAPRPGTNQIALIGIANGYSSLSPITPYATAAIQAMIWDGDTDTWMGSTKTLLSSPTAHTQNYHSTDAADIDFVLNGTNAGEAVAVWGTAEKVWTNVWNESTDWGSNTLVVDLGVGNTVKWLRQKADPNSDDLILVIEDVNEQIYTVRYDGDTRAWGSFTSTPLETTAYGNADYSRPLDVVWDLASGSNHVLLAYSDTTGLRFRRSSDGGVNWGTEENLDLSYRAYWVQLERDASDTIHVAIQDHNDNLRAWTWTGSPPWTDSTPTVITNNLERDANHNVEPFALTATVLPQPPLCSQSFNYFKAPIDVTPSVVGSWRDVDVSAYVPAGATGVIVQWVGTTVNVNYGVRAVGSADAFWPRVAQAGAQGILMAKLDANRVFQTYSSNTDLKFYLMGYTGSGVTFFTTAPDKTITATGFGNWEDVDISSDTGGNTAIGAIFTLAATTAAGVDYGVRKKGSTDNHWYLSPSNGAGLVVIGVDGNEIAQMERGANSLELYLSGYVTSGAVFFTNSVDKSTATVGSFVDVDITGDIGSDDANGAILEICNINNPPDSTAIRRKGAGYDFYQMWPHGWALTAIDSDDIFEQKIETFDQDIYITGYTLACGPSLTLNDHASGQVTDKFTTTASVTDTLYQFELSRSGSVRVDTLRVHFTTDGGVVNNDVSDGELWEDTNGNGTWDDAVGGDTLIQGGVGPSAGVLTFATNFMPSFAGTTYFIRATVSNLTGGDTTTFSVGTATIDVSEVGVSKSGSATDAVHTQDITGSLTLADHSLGQVSDQFGVTTPVIDVVLFSLRLSSAGPVTVSELRVNFTTTNGVTDGDVTNGELWQDNNNDGLISVGDAMIDGPVTPSGGVLTFTTDFSPSLTGTDYLVRASVSNLVSGDTTIFSVGTDDADAGAAVTESGSITDAAHTQDGGAGATADVYYSVGTSRPTDLKTGAPSISISNGTATLTAAQTNDVGVGDEISYNGGTIAYIKSVISPTQFVLHTATGGMPANVTGVGVDSIMRAFVSIPDAEANSIDANHINNSDLTATGADCNLTWVCYNDGPFNEGATIKIEGYTTDASHIITLTVAGASQVASGTSQRHVGMEGTGARVVSSGGGEILAIADEYVTAEWLELDGNGTSKSVGLWIDANATVATIEGMIIHDFGNNGVVNGILSEATSSTSINNNLVYDVESTSASQDAWGIRVRFSAPAAEIYNNTVYNLGNTNTGSANVYGIETLDDANKTVKNNIVIDTWGAGTGTIQDYALSAPASADYDYNLSSDGSASGANSLTGENAGEFVDAAGRDLHLASDANAVGSGIDLTGIVTYDIDGQNRPIGTWDMGADEAAADWWNGGWSARKKIGFKNSGRGQLDNFPVLVCLDSSTIDYSKVQDQGQDLRFVDKDNVTVLAHEIEDWDESGTSYVWVNVPRIEANTNGDFIYMYYDNPFALDGQDVNNTWDANYKGVWHLKENPDDPAPQFTDSTSNGNAGTANFLTGSNQVPGQINGSLFIDDIDDAVENNVLVPHDPSLQMPGAVTVSAWINSTDAAADTGGIAMKWDSVVANRNYWLGKLNNTQLGFFVDDTQNVTVNWSLLNDGGFHHVVGVADAGSLLLRIYVDGFEQNTAAYTGTSTTGTGDFRIGNGTTVLQEFGGIIDEVRVADVARSSDWISAQYECGMCNFVAVGEEQTTVVELLSFTATGFDSEVLLEWETASEIDNLGFYLYRSESLEGPYERVNSVAVPGLGSSPVGARYRYVDSGLVNGKTYFYELEDFEASGKRERHGPVSATPVAGATLDPPEDDPSEDIESSPALITYGDPESVFLHVTKRGRGSVVLELETGGFYAEPQSDGSVRLSVPGFAEEFEAGTPAIPVKRAWMEALAGKNVRITSVRAKDVTGFSLRPSSADAPDIEVSRRGALRAGWRPRRGGAAFRGKGLYPEEAARVLSVGFQDEVKKALLEMAPLRWDRNTGQLLIARRLEVHVVFDGRVAEERSLGGSRGRLYRRRRTRGASAVVAHLSTHERGLYGVRFEDVFGTRGRGVSVGLSRQGGAVPYYILPNPKRFGRGSVLYFVSEGESLNPYGKEAVYELAVGREGEIMEELDAMPSGPSLVHYRHSEEVEENHYISIDSEEEPYWIWDVVMSGGSKAYGFEVSSLAETTESGRLTLWLQAVSSEEDVPTIRVRVYVNDVLVSEPSWVKSGVQPFTMDIAPHVLREGENTLVLENASPSRYTALILDRFHVGYPRMSVAEEGVLRGVWTQTGTAEVIGVGDKAFVLDVTESPQWLTKTNIGTGDVLFRAEADHEYLVVTGSSVLEPEVRRPKRSGLKNKRNRADYIIVGPREMLLSATPLLELRKNQGLRARSVAIEDVYTEFGYGEVRPEGLQEFLRYVYHEWSEPRLRYVVLLGDGTYDYKNYLGAPETNQVPPRWEKTTWMWTASDPAYARVNGDDVLPDLAIGRLPATTAAEARVMVEKIVTYEISGQNLTDSVVLVADNPDEAGDFETDAEELAGSVLSGLDPQKIYLNRLGTASTRAEIQDALNAGSSLVSYLGHGAVHIWAHENIFNTGTIQSLLPQEQQPLVLTINCLNGFFHYPYFDALAEELVKAEGKGAVAALSPSGLSLNTSAHRFHEALLEELLSGNHEYLGDAILAAQARYAEEGNFLELLGIFHLFGDPAMKIHP